MRRLFIIRRDLHLSPGKLAAMVGHCCEAYWTNLLKRGVIKDQEYHTFPTLDEEGKSHWFRFRHPKIAEACKKAEEEGKPTFKVMAENPSKTYLISQVIDKDIWDNYVNDIFTKTICEAKNLNQLMKAKTMADELGLVENIDYGFINDCCKTETTPENPDGTCTVGIWFRPLPDDVAHKISKKYLLYRDKQ